MNIKIKNIVLTRMALLLFILALGFSFFLYSLTSSSIKNVTEKEFEHLFERNTASIQRELDLNIFILESLQSYYKASSNINREEFKLFVTEYLKKNNSIQALSWVPKVLNENKESYLRETRKELGNSFLIKEKVSSKMIEVREKAEYFPVDYIEPLSGNIKAQGFDLSSSQTRLKTLNAARNKNEITATARIKLIQEEGTQFGFLVIAPAWDNNNSQDLKGFYSAVFRIGDMINTALAFNKLDSSMIDLWLVDTTNKNKEELLFTNTNMDKSEFTLNTQKINIHGRDWRLYAKPSSLFNKKHESNLPLFSLFMSLFITILITYIIILKSVKAKELEKLVKQKTKEIEKSKEELENFNLTLSLKIEKAVLENNKKDKLLLEQSKLAAMGEMIASIAHQWRQPLNTLAIQLQFIEDDFEDGLIDKEYLDNYSKESMKLVNFMTSTIDEFRDFFIIDKVSTKVSIKNKILNTMNILKAQLENNNIKVEITGDDFDVLAHKGELQQVFLNIINNAKDALISNEIKNPEINIELSNDNDKGYIKISDNAGGIKEDVIDRIFEPYFTTKEQGKGTGLGLYMSKLIVDENMSGNISAKNNEYGVSFTIELGVLHE